MVKENENLTIILFLVELLYAQMATPTSFRWFLQRRIQAVHVVATVTIVAEQQLVVIVGGSTQSATFTFNALPAILFNGNHHVLGEL